MASAVSECILPPVRSPLRAGHSVGGQRGGWRRHLLPCWYQDLWSPVGPRLLQNQWRKTSETMTEFIYWEHWSEHTQQVHFLVLNLCRHWECVSIKQETDEICVLLSTQQKCCTLGIQALTCAMTPGLRGKGWMAGAWVTSGSVLSIRTEYPDGWFGLDPIPAKCPFFKTKIQQCILYTHYT